MMKYLPYVVFGLLLALGFYFFAQNQALFFMPNDTSTPIQQTTQQPLIYAENLSVPWGIVTLPNGDILISERTGTLTRLSSMHTSTIVVPSVASRGEGGLLGIATHPDFAETQWLYIYHTTEKDGEIKNQVMRYTFANNQLTDPKTIIDGIPGAAYHDGGRIAFGPDAHLYITTGDGGEELRAQDLDSLGGKILRVTEDGDIPADNPFANSPVYSYGHRNPQGIAWDSDGNLWSTEHGRSGAQSGFDELNRIVPGGNYGWPHIEGDETRDGMIAPVIHSGPDTTWAPASLAIHQGSLYWGGLRGEAIYHVKRTGKTVTNLTAHFSREYGRIRTLFVGPNNMLYFMTSNTDGRGAPQPNDDKLYGIPVKQLK